MQVEEIWKLGSKGQALVEYALIIVLVILASVTAVGIFGTSLIGLFSRIVANF